MHQRESLRQPAEQPIRESVSGNRLVGKIGAPWRRGFRGSNSIFRGTRPEFCPFRIDVGLDRDREESCGKN